MEIIFINRVEKPNSSILKNAMEECGEPLKEILPKISELCDKDIRTVRDIANLLIIINKQAKEI